MAEEELSTSFQMPPIDSKRGQMMLIYLPEGAVIVDRGEVAAGSAPEQKIFPHTEAPAVTQSPSHSRRRVEHIVLRRRHKIDWVHNINIAFTSFVALVAVLPWIITTVFGFSVFGAKTSSPALDIARGDLVISHAMPVNRVNSGDVILLRNNNTWNLQLRQVTSKTTTGNTTTLITNSGKTTPMKDVFTVNNNSYVHYCSTYIPYFGYFTIFFTSIVLKTLVVVGVMTLNLVVYIQRRRGRHIEEKLAFIAK